ncbi:NUMOD4 domain-containing protein [Bacillus cereus group sp. BfR-BA-01315]|uniref:NUMOD4 domain-containing protein n=1 Tax=Bacillus cereus group sp. BfR-BA-01315 TaxID=2920292 RepID=UPI001F565441|nr:NUMOD4 domain-containing protein [Bacillus cereus group sp. BfR-BA-01315]
MTEIWKDIEGYEGYYQVSNTGKIKNKRNSRIRKNCLTKYGYLNVQLLISGKDKTFQVHRLVAQAFIPNPNNKTQVNHIDGNKLNNNIDNLEWVTPKENMKHAWDIGLYKDSVESIKKNAIKAQLATRKKVAQYSLDGDYIRTFDSMREASRLIGRGGNGSISACCNGKLKTAYGYVWKKVD